jgi:hypothetical protein
MTNGEFAEEGNLLAQGSAGEQGHGQGGNNQSGEDPFFIINSLLR